MKTYTDFCRRLFDLLDEAVTSGLISPFELADVVDEGRHRPIEFDDIIDEAKFGQSWHGFKREDNGEQIKTSDQDFSVVLFKCFRSLRNVKWPTEKEARYLENTKILLPTKLAHRKHKERFVLR
jgi:hypothetical protein